MSTQRRAGRERATYAFINAHHEQFPVQVMCRLLAVAPSGYYGWCQQPLSNRAQEDARLLRLVCASFTASYGTNGSPRREFGNPGPRPESLLSIGEAAGGTSLWLIPSPHGFT